MADVNKMVSVCEAYIHFRTGREVRINIQQFVHQNSLVLLIKAYDTAVGWMQVNKIKMELFV